MHDKKARSLDPTASTAQSNNVNVQVAHTITYYHYYQRPLTADGEPCEANKVCRLEISWQSGCHVAYVQYTPRPWPYAHTPCWSCQRFINKTSEQAPNTPGR